MTTIKSSSSAFWERNHHLSHPTTSSPHPPHQHDPPSFRSLPTHDFACLMPPPPCQRTIPLSSSSPAIIPIVRHLAHAVHAASELDEEVARVGADGSLGLGGEG